MALALALGWAGGAVAQGPGAAAVAPGAVATPGAASGAAVAPDAAPAPGAPAAPGASLSSGGAVMPGAAPAPDGALAALEREQQALFERAAPAVAFLASKEGFGSAFFVADGLLLTNAHVVRGRDRVRVVLHDGRRLDGEVVERGAGELDLALVRVPVTDHPRLRLAGNDALRVGSWVASIGHGLGGVWTFTTGMVSNIYPFASEKPVIQTQVPLNPGNSGGPLLDRQGRVVGVVTAGVEGASALNFAIRADVALRSLEALEPHCACLVVRAPRGVAVFVDGASVGQGPRVAVALPPGRHDVFAVVGGRMRRQAVDFPAVRRVELTAADAP